MSDEHPSEAQEPATGPVPRASDPHPVTDPYVARRLAEGAAARAEQSGQETENLVGEPPAQGAFLFYVLLGFLISLLLLAVIFRTSEPARRRRAPPRPRSRRRVNRLRPRRSLPAAGG